MAERYAKPITAWSASRLSAYERCPFAFAEENVYGNKAPKGPAMERGIEVHDDMADVLRGKLTLGQVRHAPAHLNDFVPTINDLKRNAPIVEEKWAFTKGMGREDKYFGPNVWYRASLDAGVFWPDNSFTVVDWKTGKRYGSNDEQMEQYAMMLFARFRDVREIETVLAYLDTGDVERAEFQRADYHRLKEKWYARVAPLFADKIFAPRPGPHCRWCHFRKSNDGPCNFG